MRGKSIIKNYVIMLIRQQYDQSNLKSPIHMLHIPVLSGAAQKLVQNRISVSPPEKVHDLTLCFMTPISILIQLILKAVFLQAIVLIKAISLSFYK